MIESANRKAKSRRAMKSSSAVQYGSMQPLKGAPSGGFRYSDRRSRTKVLMGIAALCGACGIILTATNNYILEEGFPRSPPAAAKFRTVDGATSLKVADQGAPVVALTPDLVRTILNLPEKEQMALVLDAESPAKHRAQMSLIAGAVREDPSTQLTQQQLHDEEEEGEGHVLEEHVEHHHLTPGQESAERMWALIFVTAIVTASVLFETMKELIESNTPVTMRKVVEKFFGELATLGFIGTIAFVLTTGFAGHESVLGHLSFWYTGDDHLLIHEFEILHFLIFFVMIFFVSAVLVILQIAVNQKRVWSRFEKKLETPKDKDGNKLPPREEKKRILKLMHIPDESYKVEGTLTSEYTKPHMVREAEFMRFRQRFLDDAEFQVAIPPDFNFADYLTRCVSHILAEVVEIGVEDWVVLWTVFLLLFILLTLVQSCFPNLAEGEMPVYVVCAAFALLQVFLLVSAVMGFRTLSYIKSMLLPAMDKSDVGHSEEGGTEGKVVTAPLYAHEMKVIVEESGFLHWVLTKTGYKTRKPSKHEQLFGPFGSSGPSFFLSFIKLVLLGSVVSIAVLCVVLFGPLWELNFLLPFLALVPSVVCVFLTPRMVILYTWCCSTEMLKNSEVVIEVVREQKQEKLINIMRILTMLSFFLDQVEFLKSMAQTSSSNLDEKAQKSISDRQWEQLRDATDPQVLEDLEKLFNQYDDDASGELDEAEVKELVEQLGTSLTDEEAAGLFQIMDADGSGSVDFKEFAMVVLHQKNARTGKLNLSAVAHKMFAIFDKDNTGVVREDDVLKQMAKIGSNWDREGVRFFLQQIDKDGSGEIEKYEFVQFIERIEAEVSF